MLCYACWHEDIELDFLHSYERVRRLEIEINIP